MTSTGSPMELSDAGIKFIEAEEGLRYDVYPDSRGLPTVGIGHLVIPSDGLKLGDSIADPRVRELFDHDSSWDTAAINSLVTAPLTQYQFDAVFSLVFNIGAGPKGFRGSHVLYYLNCEEYEAAADAFLQWRRAGLNPNELLPRRERERHLFLTGEYTSSE